MNNCLRVISWLREMQIDYALHEHAAEYTIDDCTGVPGIDWETTEIAKNIFLCNRQRTKFYLLLLRHDVPLGKEEEAGESPCARSPSAIHKKATTTPQERGIEKAWR